MCRRLITLDSASGTCDVETHHIVVVFRSLNMICTVLVQYSTVHKSSYELHLLDLDEFYDVELSVLIFPRLLDQPCSSSKKTAKIISVSVTSTLYRIRFRSTVVGTVEHIMQMQNIIPTFIHIPFTLNLTSTHQTEACLSSDADTCILHLISFFLSSLIPCAT